MEALGTSWVPPSTAQEEGNQQIFIKGHLLVCNPPLPAMKLQYFPKGWLPFWQLLFFFFWSAPKRKVSILRPYSTPQPPLQLQQKEETKANVWGSSHATVSRANLIPPCSKVASFLLQILQMSRRPWGLGAAAHNAFSSRNLFSWGPEWWQPVLDAAEQNVQDGARII